MGYSSEVLYRVYDDKTGAYVSVAQDGDGLGLVEVRSVDDDSTTICTLTMTPEQAALVRDALTAFLASPLAPPP